MASIKEKFKTFLGWMEDYTQTDITYLAAGGFWTTTRFFVALASSIVTMVAFGNFLPKETYGVYSYLMSLAASLGFLTLSGMSVGIIRATAHNKEVVVPYALKLQLRYNTLAVIGIGIAALYYLIKGNSVFAISLGILSLALPLTSAFHIFEAVLIGKKRFDMLAILSSVSTLIGTAAIVVSLLLIKNVATIILVYALSSFIPTLSMYWYVSRNLPKEKPSPEDIAKLRETSFHLTGAGIISTLAQYLDKIVLFQVAGPAALAVYGFAIAGPERVKGLVKNWSSMILPRLAAKSLEEMRINFYKRFKLLILGGVILCVGYIFIAPVLFRWLFPQYLDSILYSQFYSLSLIVIPSLVYVGSVFNGLNMLRAVYIHSLGTQLLRIGLFVICGWRWQIWGLVAATILSYSLGTLYGIFIWERESKRLINNR